MAPDERTLPPAPQDTDNGPPSPPDYRAAWADYRRRRQWFWGEYVGGFFALMALLELGQWLGWASLVETGFAILSPVWMLVFVVVAIRLQLFKCPRCGLQFFKTFWSYNPFAKRCRHCGLPKWANTDRPEHGGDSRHRGGH
jgi:hypothetical protein